MVSIELVTGEPVVVEADDVQLMARQIFESQEPPVLTTTAGVQVVINPAHVVRISSGHHASV